MLEALWLRRKGDWKRRTPSSRSVRTKPPPRWFMRTFIGSRAICPTPATGIGAPDSKPADMALDVEWQALTAHFLQGSKE